MEVSMVTTRMVTGGPSLVPTMPEKVNFAITPLAEDGGQNIRQWWGRISGDGGHL
jgi:hypothetical protein